MEKRLPAPASYSPDQTLTPSTSNIPATAHQSQMSSATFIPSMSMPMMGTASNLSTSLGTANTPSTITRMGPADLSAARNPVNVPSTSMGATNISPGMLDTANVLPRSRETPNFLSDPRAFDWNRLNGMNQGGAEAILNTSSGSDSRTDANAVSSTSTEEKPKPCGQTVKDEAYWEKRKKNNESARRSREARRHKEQQIAEVCVGLKSQISHMKMLVEFRIRQTHQMEQAVFGRPMTEFGFRPEDFDLHTEEEMMALSGLNFGYPSMPRQTMQRDRSRSPPPPSMGSLPMP